MFQSQQSSLKYFPPPTDLCAHLGQLTLTHLDFEPRPRLYEDPNAASPSWITTPTDPITYGTASPVAALNSASKNDWMKQSLVNNVIGSTMNQSNLIQLRQYDVCNVVCKTKDVCKRHLMGKKHPRNLQATINPVTALFPEISNTINNVSIVDKTGNVGGQLIFGASGVANFHELDRKKQQLLNAGAPVGSIRMCTICNVACNSHDAFVKHISGRRHVAQQICLIGAVENPAADGCSGADAQKSKKMIARSEAAKEDLETKKQKVMEGGAAATAIRVCVFCNVVCNSQKGFNYHLTGQKHATMVKKLANGRIPTVTPQTR